MSEDKQTLDGEYIEADGEERVDTQTLLNYSQKIRKRFVQELTHDGLPTDNKDREFLLQALREMDQTSVNRSKLDIDREALSNDRQAQMIVEKIYQSGGNVLESSKPVERSSPEPQEGELPEYSGVENETKSGLVNEDSKGFLSRMDGESEQES